MISDKTDSSSDKNTKKAKNKVLGHLLSLFFGILLGGLLCLLLVVAARHMGLISFGEADSFYDTAVSYYSEQFGDAASAQSQDPPSFARFYTRAADTSILNSDVSLDLERILQENVLLEGEGAEDADTADSDAADSESATAFLAKEITGKKIRPASKLQESCTLDGISRDFTDLTVNPSSPAAIQLDAVHISFYILAVWDWQKEKTGIFCRHGTGDLVLFGILIESNLSTGVGGYGFDGAKQCKVCDPTAFLFTGKVYRVGREGNGDLHVFLLAGRKRDLIYYVRIL